MVEIRSPEELREWLGSQPESAIRSFAITIAARAALRVTPLVKFEIPEGQSPLKKYSLDLISTVFRAAAVARLVATFPEQTARFERAAAASSFDATSAAQRAPWAAFSAAAAISAANAVIAFETDVAATAAAAAAADSARAAAFAYSSSDQRAEVAATVMWESITADVKELVGGGLPASLARQTLWPLGEPAWAKDAWELLKDLLLARRENWEVWTTWYETVRTGGSTGPEALEIARVLIPDEIWNKGSAVSNAEIRRLEEEFAAREKALAQRPAPWQFRVVDDKIDVAPEDAKALDPAYASDLFAEAKRKAEELRDRLRKTLQDDPKPLRHVEQLLRHLGGSFADVRPGLIRSSWRSLEADAKHYDTPEGRDRLFPDALAEMRDLADTLRDLAACFPKTRDIEAEAIAADLVVAKLPDVTPHTDAIVAVVAASDGATDSAKAAIADAQESVVNSREPKDQALQSAYLVLDIRDLTRTGAKYLSDTGRRLAPVVDGVKRETAKFARDLGKEVRSSAIKGTGIAVKGLIIGGVGALLGAAIGDVSHLAGTIGSLGPVAAVLNDLLPKGDQKGPEQSPAPPDPAPSSREGEGSRSDVDTNEDAGEFELEDDATATGDVQPESLPQERSTRKRAPKKPGPAKKAARKRGAAKKPPGKRATAKKAGARKSPTKRGAAKKSAARKAPAKKAPRKPRK